MIKQFVALLVMAMLLVATSAIATTVTVTYDAMNYSGLSGAFSGVDTDNDGWLKLPELTDWFSIYHDGADFSALNDIGDFDYINNLWVPNAYQWDHSTQDAYMTWDNWYYSVSTSNVDWVLSTTIEIVPVPEPATVFLLGVGLLGLVAYRRKVK